MSETQKDTDRDHHDVRDGRSAEEQLRIDLLNTFHQAFQNGVSAEDVEEQIEDAKQAAKEDANV